MVAGQITRAMVLDLKYHHNYDIMMYPWHIYRAAKPKKTVDLNPFPFPPPDGDDPAEGLPIPLISSRNTSQSKFGQK